MAGIIRFYYDENNEDVYEASILNSFKVIKNDNQHLTISIKTMDKTYDFNISSDDRWKNDLQLIVSFFNQNLEKVLNGSTGCKIDTFKDRCYVYFNFYEDFDGDAVEHGKPAVKLSLFVLLTNLYRIQEGAGLMLHMI